MPFNAESAWLLQLCHQPLCFTPVLPLCIFRLSAICCVLHVAGALGALSRLSCECLVLKLLFIAVFTHVGRATKCLAAAAAITAAAATEQRRRQEPQPTSGSRPLWPPRLAERHSHDRP